MNQPRQLPPFEIGFNTHREGGRISLKFRYERLDATALGPNDGQTLQAFAGLLETIGEALKQGRSREEIQTAIDAAVESFEKIQAARKARQQEETPTHG
jgi:hypothetical protein